MFHIHLWHTKENYSKNTITLSPHSVMRDNEFFIICQ